MGLTLNGKKVLDRTLLRGQEFILDADEDSSLTADTDDQLDLRLGGNDVFVFKTSELDISGVNIVNCGDIALDSISDDDGTGINIAMMDASTTALTIQEAANAYLTFDTSNGTENIILGKKLTGGAVEIEGSAFDINGGTVDAITSLTVGTDGSGADVYFYSATGGDHLFWDSSEELLTITGTNGQTALNVADGNVMVADTLYLFDAGGESLSSDGTDLTIASGALINLTATSDVVIPVNIGLVFGDGAEKIESNNTDFTINSGGELNLTATSDVVIPVNVGLHLGDGAEKLESNNTDLTINSGVDINLTATADINVPASVGMTFGDDGEKIEGDGTDLTIASSGVLNLNATSGIAINGQDITNGGVIFLTEQAAAEADVEAKGQIWVKTATPNELWFTDDAGADVQLGLASGAHAILDGSVHSDSVADAVTRGSLIYGNSTPKWDELVLGAANTFVGSDGTDISYRTAAQVLASLSGAAGAAFAWNSQNLTGIGTLGMTGRLTITPGASGALLDFELETEWVNGTLIRADFGGATTLDDDAVGVWLDFNSNVSLTTDKDVTGYQIKLPAFTQSAANTTTIIGFNLPTAGALVQDTAAGTLTWKGINIQMPNITQTTGAVTSTGITITGGTVTSGTSYGLIVDANAGNVGIGVTDPDTLLELYKVGTQLKLSGGAADYATFAVAADGALTITTVDTDAAEGDIILMPDGNIGIGTTEPAGKLDVVGSGRFTGWTVGGTGQGLELGVTTNKGYIQAYDRTASGYIPLHFASSTFYLIGGDVGIGTTSPGQILDVNQGSGNMIADGYDSHSARRFKKNIAELTTSDYATVFEQLDTLKLFRYRLKHDHKGRLHLGILADDPTTPSILKGASDKYESLSLGDIIMFLAAAVKGLNHRVKTLEGGI